MDKLESRLAGKHSKLEEKGRKSLENLREMMEDGMPTTNEIAIFGGVPFRNVCDIVTLDDVFDEEIHKVACDQPRSDNLCEPWAASGAEYPRFSRKTSKLIRGQ